MTSLAYMNKLIPKNRDQKNEQPNHIAALNKLAYFFAPTLMNKWRWKESQTWYTYMNQNELYSMSKLFHLIKKPIILNPWSYKCWESTNFRAWKLMSACMSVNRADGQKFIFLFFGEVNSIWPLFSPDVSFSRPFYTNPCKRSIIIFFRQHGRKTIGSTTHGWYN